MPKSTEYRCFEGIPASQRKNLLPLVTTVFEQNKKLFDYCTNANISLDIALDIILEYILNEQDDNPEAMKRYLDKRAQEIYESMGSKPGDGSILTIDDFEILGALYETEEFQTIFQTFQNYLSMGEMLALANVALYSPSGIREAFTRAKITIEYRTGMSIDLWATYCQKRVIRK